MLVVVIFRTYQTLLIVMKLHELLSELTVAMLALLKLDQTTHTHEVLSAKVLAY